MNKQEHKICIIVNNKNVPLGIFTDEDIRRKIIKNNYRNLSVEGQYNKKFKYCYSRDSESKIKKILNKYAWINIFLVVDKRTKKLIGILDKDIYLKNKYLENEALILAGGFGERLKPLTNYTPKSMLAFSGRPLLESTIYSLKSSGFRKINISVNYLSEQITDFFGDGSNYNLSIKYFKESKKLGTAGPLYFFKKKKIDKPFLVINGDIYTSLNFKSLINFHEIHKNDLTVCCHDYISRLPYGIIEKKKLFIHEKPELIYLINSGIYVFEPKLLKNIKDNKFLNMDELINRIYKKKMKIGLFKIHENVLDIGTFSTYEFAKSNIKNV